jgi:hypothetical protein
MMDVGAQKFHLLSTEHPLMLVGYIPYCFEAAF